MARKVRRKDDATEDRLQSLRPMLGTFSRVTGLTATVCEEHRARMRAMAWKGTGAVVLPCDVIKRDPELERRCGESDLSHMRLAHQLGRYVIYECHAGMVDIAVPIPGSPTAACVLTGQVLPRPLSDEEREGLVRRLTTPTTTAARLRRAFAKTPFMPEWQIEAAAKLLAELVEYSLSPSAEPDATPLRTYVAGELLKRRQWHELEGIARLAGVQAAPKIAVAFTVPWPSWRGNVDWQGLNRARELIVADAPSALAVLEGDKLLVLYSELEGLQQRVVKLVDALRATGLQVAAGVGRPCDARRDIWESCQEAETALGYRFMTNDAVIFLETIGRKGERPRLIPAAARDIGLLVRLGNPSRAREVLHALTLELGREPHARPWVLDCSIEILALLVSELRDAGNRSDALPGILRHFVMAGYRANTLGELLSLLEWSVEQLISHSHSVPSQPADLAERVCDYVERHLAEPINLQRLCKETLFVSPTHFSRVFHKAKGMRFIDWLAARRIERATQLLATTEQSVASIASSCGYDDPRYFSRAFRKATGKTPSQYRQASGADASG